MVISKVYPLHYRTYEPIVTVEIFNEAGRYLGRVDHRDGADHVSLPYAYEVYDPEIGEISPTSIDRAVCKIAEFRRTTARADFEKL